MNQKLSRPIDRILVLSFLIASFLYIIIVVNPVFWFHKMQPAFLTTTNFFKSYSTRPGGFSEWVSNLVMQTFQFTIVGSIVLFAFVLCLAFLTFNILKQFKKNIVNKILALLPVVLVITLASNYNFPFSTVISLLLVASLLIPVIKNKNQIYFLAYYLAAAIVVYYFSGSGFLWLFTGSSIFLVIKKGSQLKGLNIVYIGLISFLIFWTASIYLFPGSENSGYFYLFSPNSNDVNYSPNVIFYLYIFCLPVLLGIKMIIQYLTLEKANTKKSRVYYFSAGAIVLAVGILTHILTFNSDAKKITASNYYSFRNDPVRTVNAAMSCENYSFTANMNYNLAILRSGNFTSEFFNFFQVAGTDALYPEYRNAAKMSLISADFYYEIGDIREAKFWAIEELERFPNNSRLLKLLVKINLITGDYSEADKFLQDLKNHFFVKDFVKKYEAYVSDTALIQKDQELMLKRNFVPDFKEVPKTPALRFSGLLQANPKNKAAYECLMLYYLLDGDLEKFAEHYKDMPEYFSNTVQIYEEAILLYGATNRISVADEFGVSQTNINRFKHFAEELKKREDNDRQAFNEMYSDYGKTYFYYFYFVLPQILKPEYARSESVDENNLIEQ